MSAKCWENSVVKILLPSVIILLWLHMQSFDLTLQHPKEVSSSHNIYKSKNIAFAVTVLSVVSPAWYIFCRCLLKNRKTQLPPILGQWDGYHLSQVYLLSIWCESIFWTEQVKYKKNTSYYDQLSSSKILTTRTLKVLKTQFLTEMAGFGVLTMIHVTKHRVLCCQ